MTYINIVVMTTLAGFAMMFYMIKNNRLMEKAGMVIGDDNEYASRIKANYRLVFMFLLLVAFVSRFMCAIHYDEHTDITCFKYWADRMANVGPSQFYHDTQLTDYPPGYMYILAIVGHIRNLFGLDYDSAAFLGLIKVPAIIFDIALGLLIYHAAKKKWNEKISLIIMSLYLFNPIVYLNSSVWGQVDSVFTFCVVLMCLLVYHNKIHLAYFAYGIGVLIKPQMFLFTPVLLFALLEEIFVDNDGKSIQIKFQSKKFIYQMKYCIPAIIMTFLIAAPFGLDIVIEQYISTMGSYEYATVNAYNLWGMFGLNWAPQTNTLFMLTYAQWGTLFILCIVMVAILIWISNIKDRTRYIVMGAFICAGMFTLSVRMHERYIYPAIILLLVLFIYTRKVNAFVLYTLYTIAHFYNGAHVLFFYDPYNFDANASPIILISIFQVILFVLLVIYTAKNYISKENNDIPLDDFSKEEELIMLTQNEKKPPTIRPTKKLAPMTKKDYVIMLIITCIYSVIALYNLGDMNAPESGYSSTTLHDEILIELSGDVRPEKLVFYNGNYEKRNVTLELLSEDLQDVLYNTAFEINEVFCWNSYELYMDESMPDSACVKYLRLTLNDSKSELLEFGICDAAGKLITPVNLDDEKVAPLFDEQDLIPEQFSFRNSTYFDEIYHARTAYEYTQGLYSYENTHPPLGKAFIALGMLIFGVNPFGWRIAGTLFGIIMVPLMYVFGKKVFGKTEFAAITCILMTFDFMHFAQTRIATIDVFVVLFIILMYYFMYKYYCTSFYDTKFSKTLIPLGLSGIMMGLGCASKWTGCYAGLGLGVIFFYTMFVRYKEYLYAKKNINGQTAGISHKYVVDNFFKFFRRTIAYCVLMFMVVPATIYTLSYIPFVGCNESPKGLIGRMLYNQNQMFSYHKDCIFEHPYSSRWFEWPFMFRPIWYYSGDVTETTAQGISSFGNPLVWWLGIFAFFYIAYIAYKRRDKIAIFFTIAYLAQLLPWTLVERTTFIYHYFPCVPFVVLMNVYCFYLWVHKGGRKETPIKSRMRAVWIYTTAVVILFAMFYPVLSGATVDENYVYTFLRWFDGWVLIR